MNRFQFGDEPFLHPIASATTPVGVGLTLFADHPLAGAAVLPLPTEYVVNVSPSPDHISADLYIATTTPTVVSVSRVATLSAKTTLLVVTTTIRNHGASPITFYPAEIIPFVGKISKEATSETDLLFYSPFAAGGEEKGYQIIGGNADNPQFLSIREQNLFVTRYQHQAGRVKLTNDRGWIAAQSGEDIRACAIAYAFPARKPEAVKENLIVDCEGATASVPAGQAQSNKKDAPKRLRVTYVLGRVTLAPKETFTYTALWSAVTTIGPIFDVRQGIVYSKHLEVNIGKPDFQVFYVFAALGLPREGPVGFQFLDETGNIINTNYNISLLLDPQNPRPGRAVVTYPTILTHMLAFPVELQEKMMKNTKTIRMVLLDENTKQPIRVIDESTGPWKVYEEK